MAADNPARTQGVSRPAGAPGGAGASGGDKEFDAALVWLRRDLRVDDHAALHHALRSARRVWCAFVFDRAIVDPLPRADRRVEFIRDSLVGVDAALRALAASHGIEGVGLLVRHGEVLDEIARLALELHAQAVFASHDDDPAARERDRLMHGRLAAAGVALRLGKDQVVLERDEVLTLSGQPFSVFTPYRNAWLKALTPYQLKAYPVARHATALAPPPAGTAAGVPPLEALGFERTNLHALKLPSGPAGADELLADFLPRIGHYREARNYPAVKGPSYLGTHLRFGTISVRRLAREAHAHAHGGPDAAARRGADAWLNELIWRDFYQQILYHHPRVVQAAFKPEFAHLRWAHGRLADEHFAAWCEGRTGYPLVDAAMHQINQTGYMHNRLRMLAASFLTKDLGLDWRRGEAYFALHLNDFELASNNGGWQWAAGTGTDAQPWFRIFNPVTQSRKFDPDGRFIRRYLPQLARLPDALIHAPWLARPVDLEAAGVRLGVDYPAPIVEHAQARERTLQRYAAVKAKG
ncbi:MAG: deoxyribodipyrimidine photo-lyase [Rubrivivax sp.]|nr:deoxyribodipyrimidine photo-lyase [Rubrivivax sp.]